MVDDWRRSFQAVGKELRRLTTNSSDSSSKENTGPEEIHSSEAARFSELLESDSYERIKIGDIPADQYSKIMSIKGVQVLIIDTENVPQEVLVNAASEFESIHELLNGFAVGDRAGIAEAAKTEGTGGMVDEVYSNYQRKLPHRLLPVLKDALVLRVTARKQNVSHGEMYDWRGEIAGSHIDRGNDPKEALNLVSLCSAGYFDTDRFFDRLYRTMVEHGGWDSSKYKSVVDTHVQEMPFVIFVSGDAMPQTDVCDLVRQKVGRLDEYPAPPEFVDICGRGSGAHEVIDRALTTFLESDTVPDYRWTQTGDLGQYTLRIEASSLQS